MHCFSFMLVKGKSGRVTCIIHVNKELVGGSLFINCNKIICLFSCRTKLNQTYLYIIQCTHIYSTLNKRVQFHLMPHVLLLVLKEHVPKIKINALLIRQPAMIKISP